jgi:hypothetical protein
VHDEQSYWKRKGGADGDAYACYFQAASDKSSTLASGDAQNSLDDWSEFVQLCADAVDDVWTLNE